MNRMHRHSFIVPSFKMWVLLLLGIAAGLSSCQAEHRKSSIEETENTLPVQVMTFNIRYGTANDGANRWENRKNLVYKVIRDHNPDFTGLQEALNFQIKDILGALPAYQKIGVGRDDGKTEGEYSAILYNADRFTVDKHGTFWFSETPKVPGSKDWGNNITRICSWGRFVEKSSGKAMYLFNLHLDHQSQNSREKSVELLSRKIKARTFPDPVIVTGDFNAGEDNPAIRYMKSVENPGGSFPITARNPVSLVDSYRVLHPKRTAVGTFNGFQGETGGEKIDYIFVTPTTRVLEAQIIRDNDNGRYPSDHFPVMAKLELPIH